MATPNLGITELTANQTSKVTTLNAGLTAVDVALTDFVSIDLSAGNATVSSADFRENIVLRTSGVAIPGRTVTVPQLKRLFVFDNSSGSDIVGVIRGATTINVPAAGMSILYTDGTTDGLRRISLSAVGTGANNFVELNDAPASYTGEAGKVVVVNSAETGLEFRGGVGQLGAMGPWRVVASQALSGNAVQIAPTLPLGIEALALVVVGAKVNTDDVCPYLRYQVSGVYQSGAGTYAFATWAASQGGTTAVTGATATQLNLLRDAVDWRIGSDTDEDFNCSAILFGPSDTLLHRVTYECSFENRNGNHLLTEGGGVWTGGTGAVTGLELGLVGGVATWTAGTAYLLALVGSRDVVSAVYDLSAFAPGEPTASQVLLRHAFVRSITLQENLSGSQARASVAALAQTDFDIRKNGVSIGTMRFAAAATTATFILTAASVVPGDVLTVVAPGTPDADLADVSITLALATDFV